MENQSATKWAVFILCIAGCGPVPIKVANVLPPDFAGAPSLDLATARPIDLREAVDMAEDPNAPVIVNQVPGVLVSTLAGSSVSGSLEGTGAAAQLDNPVGIALDASGTLYVTEYDGARVRRVTAAGATSTLTLQKGFSEPFAVMLNGPDQLIVQTDIDASGAKGVSTGTLWSVSIASGAATVILGGLGRPRSLAYLLANTIVVSDATRQTISLMDSTSAVLTPMASPPLNTPVGVAVMPDGSFIVADSGNHCLRRVSGNQVSMFAGDARRGMIDGPALTARFDRPLALAVDAAGNVYVSDSGANHRVRRVNLAGQVETIAGTGVIGFADGAGEQAQFYGQEGMAILPAGGTLYLADGNSGDGSAYHRIRQITLP